MLRVHEPDDPASGGVELFASTSPGDGLGGVVIKADVQVHRLDRVAGKDECDAVHGVLGVSLVPMEGMDGETDVPCSSPFGILIRLSRDEADRVAVFPLDDAVHAGARTVRPVHVRHE